MDQIYIAEHCKLKVGDRLIRHRGLTSVHHGIYAGMHNGIPLVAETQPTGVRYVSLAIFLQNNFGLLKEIRRFRGTEKTRETIIPRINKLIGHPAEIQYFNTEVYEDVKTAPDVRTFKAANNVNTPLRILTQGLIGFFAKRGMF